MKTKFVEYKKDESFLCAKCCHCAEARESDKSCESKGWFCTSETRKDKKNGYFVEVKEKKQPAKKQVSVKPPENKPTVHSMIGKFVVIETNSNADGFDAEEWYIRGIFDTEKQAIDRICEDAKKNFEDDDEATIKDGEDWASNCLILEIKRFVLPVLTTTVTCKIKDVE